jgi:hypothetical protein
MECSICTVNSAVLTSTDLRDGETVSPCGECLVGYFMTGAAALSADLSPEWAEAFGAQFDQIAANDTRPKHKPAANAGKRSPRSKVNADSGSANSAVHGSSQTTSDTLQQYAEPTIGDQAAEAASKGEPNVNSALGISGSETTSDGDSMSPHLITQTTDD